MTKKIFSLVGYKFSRLYVKLIFFNASLGRRAEYMDYSYCLNLFFPQGIVKDDGS